jgi:cobalt/nickel transport system permease protein
MHMADSLISPVVGGVMWAATAGVAAYGVKKVNDEADERKIPLMGVLGAFVFAAQMINFSIPGTGSSGHLGGGMLLTILLGPYAGFLTIASVLVVQALFFADGGLLALGCNIFNLGFFPAFIAYPLIFRSMTGRSLADGKLTAGRVLPAAMLASIVGLQLGAFGVVMETLLSGITELSFSRFVLLMQPIHLAIGVVEGFVTAGVVTYVLKAKPEVLKAATAVPSGNSPAGDMTPAGRPASGRLGLRKVLIVLGALTVVTGGILSWFASTHPDGLEWSVFRATGSKEVGFAGSGGLHGFAKRLQEKIAILPDYGFKEAGAARADAEAQAEAEAPEPAPQEAGEPAPGEPAPAAWPSVSAGTTVSGFVGALLTLVLAGIAGVFIVKRVSGGRNRKAAR